MDLLLFISIFIFGTLIGSFINVVGLRYNSGLSINNARSKCFSCDTTLKWYELVPVFSYIFLRGKCRTCKSHISFQYPLIEVATGLVFVGVIMRQVNLWPTYSNFDNGMMYSALLSIYYLVVFSILFVITIYDFRHKIIPNVFVYWFMFLGLFKLVFFTYLKYPNLGNEDIFNLLSPLLLFGFIASLWWFSSGRWIGFGDAKLVFGIGAMLGFVYGVGAVVLGFWIGALWSIFLLVNNKLLNKGDSIGLKSEIPFAPFLILGTIITFLFHLDVMSLSSFFVL